VPDDRRPSRWLPVVLVTLLVGAVAVSALAVRREPGSTASPSAPVSTATSSSAPDTSSSPPGVGPPLQPVAPDAACSAIAGRTLRVPQFNIRAAIDDSGDVGLARVAAEIEAADPDLVSLNEVDDGTRRSGGVNEASYLAGATGLRAVFGPTLLGYDGGRFGNAILSRYPVIESHNTPLPQVTGFEARALLTATVRVGHRPVSFSALHLSAGVGGTEDRVVEAEAVARVLGTARLPTIVAGDLNSPPDDLPVRILRPYLLDAQEQSGTGAGLTVPQSDPDRRIDYVLYDNSFTAVRGGTRVLPSDVSDHRSVLTVLALRRKGC